MSSPEKATWILVGPESPGTPERIKLVWEYGASRSHVVLDYKWIAWTIRLGEIHTISEDFCGHRVVP